MRVVEAALPGGPEVLRVAEREIPQAGAGEVLIRVCAAGISRADAMQRQGKYPPPPGASGILGLEVSGTIEGVGPDVTSWKHGDEVCALLAGGGYAEYVAVPAGQVLPKPAQWTLTEAASLPENAFTVYDNLFTRARLRAREGVLIHGGTSGIGTTAIMFAKAFGAGFIAATAGTPEKCAACRALGADLAIDYKREDFVDAILAATQNAGVDVVLDLVGGAYVARDLDALALDGRIACIATTGGPRAEIELGKLLHKRATISGSSLRPRTAAQKAAIAQDLLAHVWPLLPVRDPIHPVIDSVYAFEEAAEAHRRLESSEHIGKILLTP
ncbi:MAG TPA: NAD(P)H-quinone oxidoreductase [Candidatus Baltobacteraceae bacterium]|nr:NAD(P)H-quinone oxidoreductase [Candidatus Baltobacteraceae bacterium]